MLKVIRNIHYTILLPIIPFFFGLVLSFLISRLLPGDPVLAYLPAHFTAEEYLAMAIAEKFECHKIHRLL